MYDRTQNQSGPLVSVIIPTFNRAHTLGAALGSALRQTHSNIEVLVVRDGGEEVESVVHSFDDSRVVFIDRDVNRGKAFSLNEALERAGGRYIAYLDDDDIWYPNHVEVLVNCLESRPDCRLAYSDLYRTYCRVQPDGRRVVLSKVLEVSRDFDRFVMLYFNHTLHVSLMHDAALLDRTGLYNENLDVLIDWDFTRRACFYTDFCHVHDITGEYYSPVDRADRLSVIHRRCPEDYLRHVLQIRTARPPKPWPKMGDVSIILDAAGLDAATKQTLLSIWRHTFYPYKLYLPLCDGEAGGLNIEMPNVVIVPVQAKEPAATRINRSLAVCEGDYVAVVPAGFPVADLWLEDSLYALVELQADCGALILEGSTERCWACVADTQLLRGVRENHPNLSVRDSLAAAGMPARRVQAEEIPFQLDQSLAQARLARDRQNWRQAADILEYAAGRYDNSLWLRSLAAEDRFKAGDYGRCAELCGHVNAKRPTVETLLLEARLRRTNENTDGAIALLRRATQILEGTESAWT